MIDSWTTFHTPLEPSTGTRVSISVLCTRNFLTFVNTTAIGYHRNPEAQTDFLPTCNNSCVYKRQKITSTVVLKSDLTLIEVLVFTQRDMIG